MSRNPGEWTRRELAADALLLAAAAPALLDVATASAVPLPPPAENGGMALAEALARRRSRRRWSPEALRLAELGQLLWAAQGITSPAGLRSAPSAGALYPLEVDVAAARVDGLAAGLYRYLPRTHRLTRRDDADLRAELSRAAHGQEWIAQAAVVVVLSAVSRRTAGRYGARAERYVAIEVGHAAQNVYLQATALALGTVVVGAFDDARIAERLGLAAGEQPLALLPVGRL